MKYNNVRVSIQGYSCASKMEGERLRQLLLFEQAKEISDLKTQVSVYLTDARIQYKPDFQYFCNKKNMVIYEEVKGFSTDVWRIKRRLWEHYGPGRLDIWKKNNRGLYLDETIISKLI